MKDWYEGRLAAWTNILGSLERGMTSEAAIEYLKEAIKLEEKKIIAIEKAQSK